MNITRLNFNLTKKGIIDILKSCDYIAVDLEMTGITVDKSIVNTKHENMDFRYLKLQHSIKQFCPLQVGICGISLKDQRFFPFTFHVVPSKETSFSFDIGSIQFLANHSFDFNKVFYEGIPYSRLTEPESRSQKLEIVEDAARPEIHIYMMSLKHDILKFVRENIGKPYDDPENMLRINISHIKKAYVKFLVNNIRRFIPAEVLLEIEISTALDYTQELIFKVSNQEILESRLNNMCISKNVNALSNWFYYQNKYFSFTKGKASNDSDIQASIWKRLIVQTTIASFRKLDAHFNNLSLSKQLELLDIEAFNEERIFQLISFVTSTTENEESMTIYQNLKQMINDFNLLNTKKVNFSEILKPLSHIPFVFHNGSLDLMHIIDKFFVELPSDYRDFSRLVRLNIKTIYDTKFIAENSLFLKSQLKFNTGLENITTILELDSNSMSQHIDYMKTALVGKNKLNHAEIEEAIYDEESDRVLNHNAGFDSYATAKAFLYEINSLFNLKLNSRDEAESYLQPFKNKLLVSGSNLIFDFEDQVNTTDDYSQLFLIDGLNGSISSTSFRIAVRQSLGLNNFGFTTIYGTNFVIISLSNRKEIDYLNEAIDNSKGSFELKIEDYTCQIIKYSKFKDSQTNKLYPIISDELV